MATVQDILAGKGSHVFSIGPDATVLDAALLMNEHKVGSLLVMSAGQVAGIITERDLLQRVVAQRRDPADSPVRDVMTTEVVCGRPETTVDEARAVMKNRRIRHMPVLDGGDQLLGLVSIGDLNAHLTRDQEVTIQVLHEYIYGRV
jgi:CBS domain-containing protein